MDLAGHCMKKVVIFTDMDGTLLNHHDYSHEAADELLNSLEELAIPVIPTTSKTFSELQDLRADLNNAHPFICENGAAIYIPVGYFSELIEPLSNKGEYLVKAFVEGRDHWRALLSELPTQMQELFVTFTSMGIKGVMELTGLARHQAEQSSDRQFGEPIQWLGNKSQLKQFTALIEQGGGKTLVGGRFVHVSGATDKGRAVQWLVQQYQQQWGVPLASIGLGDGGNDVAMLAAVDYPIIVRSPANEPPELPASATNHNQLITTDNYAPEGWVEGVSQVLSRLQISK